MNPTPTETPLSPCPAAPAAGGPEPTPLTSPENTADRRSAPTEGRAVFQVLVASELRRVRAQHGPMHSLHEGYGVLLEEMEEFWFEVKLKREHRTLQNLLSELVQIATVAQRIAEDLVMVPLARQHGITSDPLPPVVSALEDKIKELRHLLDLQTNSRVALAHELETINVELKDTRARRKAVEAANQDLRDSLERAIHALRIVESTMSSPANPHAVWEAANTVRETLATIDPL